MFFRSHALAAIGTLALVSPGLACQSPAQAMSPGAAPATGAAVPAASLAPASLAPAGAPDFAGVAERILPSVVSIHVEQRLEQSAARPEPGERGWSFRQLPGFGAFGGPNPAPREGLGSGFVIDAAEGLILTNYHVVDDSAQIDVTVGTPQGPRQTLAAQLIGKAPDFDVALLRTEKPLGVPALELGDSDGLRVGEWVMAIGNPFGLSQSMSVGIISGKHREDMSPSGQGVYDFLQTDASINPGNSGGPLVDMRGRVVGMNTAISAQGSGIGFAIPASMLARIFPSLKDKGELSRSWLGVQVQSLTPDLARSYGLPSTAGALVADVVPDSPAARAGVRAGDVLTRFDGKTVESSASLPVLVSLTESGHEVALGLWRDGREQSAKVRVETRPNDRAASTTSERTPQGFGLGLSALTPELRQRLGVQTARGVLVSEVAPGSVAARAGLRPGDVVVEVQGKPLQHPSELARALDELGAGQVLRLKVSRGDLPTFIALSRP